MAITINKFYFSGLLLLPVVLILLPANFFDTGSSICLSMVLFDQECYGCGMTRAIQHLIHGDITQASSFNKASFIVLPALILVYIEEIKRTYQALKRKS